MTNNQRNIVADEIADSLDVPNSAYEAAEQRYTDIGNWLHDPSKAKAARFSPHVYPQGSFRLGTVVRPWKHEDFDLDLACKLDEGLTKTNCSQENLKHLIGDDLNNYRMEREIQERPEEKQRCWRLNYQDHLKFHMDVVPGIPESENMRFTLSERMIKAGTAEILAHDVAELAMSITDNRHPSYVAITSDWNISNPEGYAKWFESRMRMARQLLESRAIMERVAKIDVLPLYRWKTPLQKCIQILKRHRDMMFENDPNGKPISVIITTLAAQSYQGETDLETAMDGILATMGSLVNPSAPRVPNPVNPKEDFADRWVHDPNLERNFFRWLKKAQADYGSLGQSNDFVLLSEDTMLKFGVPLDAAQFKKRSNLFDKAAVIIAGGAHTSKNGIVGTAGVKNKDHKFYG